MSAYAPQQRVLLLELSERTSAKGNAYMSGWLGKASVVAFRAEHADKHGNPVWQVFVTEPQQREEQQRAQITRHLGGGPTPANRAAPDPRPLSARELPADRAPAGRQGDGWRGRGTAARLEASSGLLWPTTGPSTTRTRPTCCGRGDGVVALSGYFSVLVCGTSRTR